ncbi:hypothetical protein CQ10_34115 [Bradyrhizobium valentinum]|uniref:Uncharacterized protein n=1 Tax=Bradyrhizobium valentinum TaxID=1518501 RepID=A0A0R3LRN3_9BRAD|nr:hypothetical protein CQ10_34115 [Bradyrhizobium valentinum]KRR10546.1 hypothetical protein CP49_12235 [Bradyrhizobium valentinum]
MSATSLRCRACFRITRLRWCANTDADGDALGHAATAARALHEYVELVTGRDAIKMLRERGKL